MNTAKDAYGMRVVTQRDNLHTVKVFGHGLCLVCLGCGRRSHLPLSKLRSRDTILHGDMTQIVDLRCRCKSCNSYLNERYLPGSQACVEAFLDAKSK